MYTALHRAAGAEPGPITDALLEAAIAAQSAETDDLDWKEKLPPIEGLNRSDFPKDVAAMANKRGGVIVYGVAEEEKRAQRRVDVGPLTEHHERALRSAAVSAVTPPIFDLEIVRLGEECQRAVVLVVPETGNGPHLVFRKELFGAPVRNDADTVWMQERDIEAMYRARFEALRQRTEALDHLYEDARNHVRLERRAWLIAVARPRITPFRNRLGEDDVRLLFLRANSRAQRLASSSHPLERIAQGRIRPGLRRWVVGERNLRRTNDSEQAWASIHHDGSLTLCSVAGQLEPAGFAETILISRARIEVAVLDLVVLIHTVGAHGGGEYEVRLGVEWEDQRFASFTRKGLGDTQVSDDSDLLIRFTRVDTTIDPSVNGVIEQSLELALDCLNQAGLSDTIILDPPSPFIPNAAQ